MRKRKKWTLIDQAKLFERLGHLLQRGYPLLTALEFLMLYVNDEKRKDLRFILQHLKQGTPFYLSFQSLQFSNEGLGYLYFAEKYGDLPNGLLHAGKMLKLKDTYVKNTMKMMRYPLFLIILLLGAFIVMQQVVIPQFLQLYESLNLPQSKFITLLIAFKSISPFLGITFFFLCAAIGFYYQFYFRSLTAIEQNKILCKIPLVKYFIKKYNTYFFAFHFGNLVENGLSINETLSVFQSQSQIQFFQEEASRIRSFLVEGDDLADILKNTIYFDKELATVIIHGQANGILARELLEYSRLIIDEFEESFTWWLRILQPTIMAAIGGMIIALYLSIMLPLYGTIQNM
ncbi:competence type IV pilus assembly protein ComGB [Calidifontibacillus erzurumensis]|uniref:Type II secretion system F family protein n=1 Tax=Calidifontibacillus erzurumensis TaxID=2741433 RepID=A0A8J8GBX6_9BACI|nr:competence type IV pilus assembly protein ComGB [Calidifontibacillus erzurumensis]NSL50351.1 type II secretion system F family protein [Calidifontibacillus erzurumensis]